MRVLVMTSPFPTHLTPIVPLAWALRAAGHEVLVVCQPDVAAAAGRAGLNVAVVGGEYDDIGRRRRAKPVFARAEEDGSRPWQVFARGWQARVDTLLGPSADVARAWRPDLIVADPLEFVAPRLAHALDIPYAHHRWGVDVHGDERWWRACQALSGGQGEGMPDPAAVFDPCPPGLQAPGLSPGSGIRFVPYNGTGSRPALPPWQRDATCVSFGTRAVALGGADLLRVTLRALIGPVLVAAPAGTREALGEVPDGVTVLEDVPLSLVLDRCALVIHHGGAGTTLTATAFGLPQLVLPQAPYLVEHGERLAATGAGALLLAEEQREENIRSAVAGLLTGAAGRAARALAAGTAAQPTPADWVGPLEKIAG
ncbi:nucleotide disphospho-sugar-binding domain-containing protein [Actinokineospora sp. NBRC 105648]|uniref:nucleotide disphospho-sugar-binding domain-containing protein n=1 Tax=Actinokineospora sp. NBRC 105648 TaxID=3032206 RepID=UPI0024A0ADD6|nr:nucleotide disphospho-sugar-binding domain-containing protein [Actinokineospora sp. NBRC 105648]GLZ36620.1 glycosyl transferase [Actinokineospora sp. NBRC 105648]